MEAIPPILRLISSFTLNYIAKATIRIRLMATKNFFLVTDYTNNNNKINTGITWRAILFRLALI